jgi:hypothetical protein
VEPSRIQAQGFSVVLVVADLQGAAGQDDVPPAARKALTDMKDFLPYKSYKLMDAAWLLGQGASAVTRLRGLEEQDYELRLVAQPTGHAGEPSSRVFVRFTLIDAGAQEMAYAEIASTLEQQERAIATLRAELSRYQGQLAAARERPSTKQAEVEALESRVAELKSRMNAALELGHQERSRADLAARRRVTTTAQRSGSRAVIDTSFTMDVGETVVVGTSRLKGNGKALIALLTAVPPKGRSQP